MTKNYLKSIPSECLFVLLLYIQPTIFQQCWDVFLSSWVEQVLSQHSSSAESQTGVAWTWFYPNSNTLPLSHCALLTIRVTDLGPNCLQRLPSGGSRGVQGGCSNPPPPYENEIKSAKRTPTPLYILTPFPEILDPKLFHWATALLTIRVTNRS